VCLFVAQAHGSHTPAARVCVSVCCTGSRLAHTCCACVCRYDLMLHYISVTWKVMCAIIPPTDYKGAYPAFAGSLIILVGIIFLTKEVGRGIRT